MIKLDKNTKYFDSIYHMCKVCKKAGKNEIRGYIKFIHVINGFMHHTNGHYLIVISTNIEDGVYVIENITRKQIIFSKVEDESVPFPNTDHIINGRYPNREYYTSFENHLTGYIAADSGIVLDSEYVKLAHNIVKDTISLYVSWSDDKKLVQFYNSSDVKVFLMPLKR